MATELGKKESMSSQKFVPIGKVHSPQGVKGQVFVMVFSGEAAWEEQWDSLFLAPMGIEQPQKTLAIENKRVHQKQGKWGFALTLENIKDRNQAEEIKGLTVLVPESFLTSDDDETPFLREVLGFQVVDQKRGPVGEVVGFSGNAFQDILVIQHPSSEKFEVPFVEPILLEILKEEKKITMDIPQGLVAGEEL